jgi:hypothetical protein
MQEVRIQVIVHPQAGWERPFGETDSHWLAIGLNTDLNEAFKTALRNTLDFLERKAGSPGSTHTAWQASALASG